VDATCTTLRAWALHLAARGWYVFPITPGAKKPPVIDRWETRASTDPDQITRWWRQVPFSIGIATGPSGLVVVDLDTPKSGETVPDRWAALGIGSGAGVLRALARQHNITVTPTFAVTTPSGGWHLYYTAPPGAPLRNTQDVIGWKIDTRAHGGYVVAPGCPAPRADTNSSTTETPPNCPAGYTKPSLLNRFRRFQRQGWPPLPIPAATPAQHYGVRSTGCAWHREGSTTPCCAAPLTPWASSSVPGSWTPTPRGLNSPPPPAP
jgi:Bifunctional DNA primase/polymerase, N-terminal